jgi:DNA-directed RNA polymerase subunit RPC12/RpoP
MSTNEIIAMIICTSCGASNDVREDDLGYEEFVCTSCHSDFFVPETVELIIEQNDDCRKAQEDEVLTGTHRIMVLGEDGVEFTIKNNVPAEYVEMLVAGYQTGYNEGQRVFSEPEMTTKDYRMALIALDQMY